MMTFSIARIVADLVGFIDDMHEDGLDPNEAAAMREWLGGRLRELDRATLRDVIDAFAALASDLEERRPWASDLAAGFRLNEALVSADPVRPHDRHAQRDILQMVRIVADISLFLDVTSEEKLDLDDSVQMSEWVAHLLSQIEKDDLSKLVAAFEVVAPEYGEECEWRVRDIANGYGLHEVIAANDPVRLAELEAEADIRPDPPDWDPAGIDWRAGVWRPYLAVD